MDDENANSILDKIGMCKDVVCRLFIEFFNDGEYMDFYVKLGTEAGKIYNGCRYATLHHEKS